MANNIDVKVRAPGANTPEDFVINLDLTAQEGIQIFIQQKWRGLIQNQQNARLVLSPLNKRNGSIIAPATTFRSIAFNPKKDILELWRCPLLIEVAIYFREGGQDIIRERKKIPFDFGTPLFHMIPTLQRVLELENEFSILYTTSIDDAGKPQSTKWLHTQFSLQYQDISAHGCLLCYPISKIARDAEMVVNSGEKVALIKQSFKKDHKSSKQRRFFSLHETFLYYFKKEKDPLPAGAIPLEYYVIQKKLKKKKFNMTLELSVPLNEIFKTLTISYKLQADSIDQLNFWFDRIRKKCVNSGDKKIFGIDLQEVVGRKKNNDKYIPKIVKECISFLEENALKQEGLFRISPSASIIELAKGKYDGGEDIALDCYDHNVAAGLLKLYFRELPEPLLTFNLYDQFIAIGGMSNNEYVPKLAEALAELPPENYITAKFLFSFLSNVAAHEEFNKMSSANLAVVFGPNLFRNRNEVNVQDCNLINNITEFLISDAKSVFKAAESLNTSLSLYRQKTQRNTHRAQGNPNVLSRQLTPFPSPSSNPSQHQPPLSPNIIQGITQPKLRSSTPPPPGHKIDVLFRQLKEEQEAISRLSILIAQANDRLTVLEKLAESK